MGFCENERKSPFRHQAKDRNIKEQYVELLQGNMQQITCDGMVVNKGEDDEIVVNGYKRSVLKTTMTYVFIFLTGGLLRLVFHWVPHWYLFATSVRCPVAEAEKILVTEIFKEKHKLYYVEPLVSLTSENVKKLKEDETILNHQIIPEEEVVSLSVHFENGVFKEVDKLLIFTCKKVTYVWDASNEKFVKLPGLDQGVPSSVLHNNSGLSVTEQFMRRLVYGPNNILVEESSILTLLFLEVLNPYYIFQIGSFILWISDHYYYYAGTIMILSFIGITVSIIQTRRHQKNLKSTIHSSDVCTVRRRIQKTEPDEEGDALYKSDVISTELLVPGDILEIPYHGCIMHCDALLLTGNCILNESMLTGESVPVTKTAMVSSPNIIYDPKEHARHTLFCGTKVIQTRYFGNEKVLAVVVRTGFSTAKGSLVRSILYPPPVDFRFEKDSYKFVALLAGIAGIGFTYTLITKILRHRPFSELIIEALDLITIVVPPALPAAMTGICFNAQTRLTKNKIYCISPRSINVSGSVDCVCFDKTGTLTEDGLDLLCVVPTKDKAFDNPIANVESLPYNTFVCGLVSCHSLTIIDKEIVGDPLDLKMFESTKWTMEEFEVADNTKFDMIFPTVLKPPKNRPCENQDIDDLEIGIIREFPFSSSLQRMGVIIRKLNGAHFEYYCKGSPEMLLNFVTKESVPKDFSEVLENYTQDGCRVIALAHKELHLSYTKLQKVSREVLEKDMTFLGLIVLENRLKPDTTPCIRVLNEANIRVIMVTGDNILTALSVARECDIIKTGENVITVNSDSSNPPQLFYTLNTHKMAPPDVSIMSNSASVISLDTVESQLHTVSTEVSKKAQKPTALFNKYRLAMTGKTWGVIKDYYPELVPRMVTRGSVFARMSPEQKQQLVQELQALGYYVAMCGDGANDCGALKAAHTGISLSDAESSVASPFTSKNPNITCVLNVIKEGRTALVTSFGVFKYMAAYSLCQFISVLILYSIDSNLTDMEFLYIDLFIITVFGFFFGKIEAYPGKLDKQTPLTSLISLSPVLSLIFQVILIIAFQVTAFEYIQTQPWFTPFDSSTMRDKDTVGCLENYAVFTIANFQCIGLAIVFSKGKPYRKSIFSNYGFIISALAMIVVSTFLVLYPTDFLKDLFMLVVPESFNFRLELLMMVTLNFVLSILVEHFIVDLLIFKKLRFKFHNIDKSKRKYLGVERDLCNDSKWPVLTSDYKSAASPNNSMPICAAEIVIEKENKFDKDHVFNKLYDHCETTFSPSKYSRTRTNSENTSIYSDTVSTNDKHIADSPLQNALLLKNKNLNGFFVAENQTSETNLDQPHFIINLPIKEEHKTNIHDDLFSSLPSENGHSSSSQTFKSFSASQNTSYDLADSHVNIPDLPFENDVRERSKVRSLSQPNSPVRMSSLSADDSKYGKNSTFELNNLGDR